MEDRPAEPNARLWEVSTGRLLATFRHKVVASTGAFSPLGDRIVTLGYDDRVRVWDARTFHGVADTPCNNREVRFSPDGQLFLTSGEGNKYVLGSSSTTGEVSRSFCWEARTGKQVSSYEDITRLRFLPDGRFVQAFAEAGMRRKARLAGCRAAHGENDLQLGTGEEFQDADQTGKMVLLTLGTRAGVRSSESGRRISPLLPHPGRIASASLSPDGRQVLLLGSDGLVRLWDLGTVGPPRLRVLERSREWHQADASPDGRWVVAVHFPLLGGDEGDPGRGQLSEIVLVDVERGEPRARWPDPTMGVLFSRDGKHLVRFSWQGTVSFLDPSIPAAKGVPEERLWKKVPLALPRGEVFRFRGCDRFGERVVSSLSSGQLCSGTPRTASCWPP